MEKLDASRHLVTISIPTVDRNWQDSDSSFFGNIVSIILNVEVISVSSDKKDGSRSQGGCVDGYCY